MPQNVLKPVTTQIFNVNAHTRPIHAYKHVLIMIILG